MLEYASAYQQPELWQNDNMPLTIETIGLAIFLIFSIPVVCALTYQNRDKLRLTLSKLNGLGSNPELDYERKQEVLWSLRKELAALCRKEKQFLRIYGTARGKAELLERRAMRKKNSSQIKVKAQHQRKLAEDLKEQLEKQRLTISKLQNKIDSLQAKTLSAKASKGQRIAERREHEHDSQFPLTLPISAPRIKIPGNMPPAPDPEKTKAVFDKLESIIAEKESIVISAKEGSPKNASKTIQSRIDAFEQLVVAREAQAAKEYEPVSSNLSLEDQKKVDELASKIEIGLKQIELAFDTVRNLGNALDSSLENSFKELLAQQSSAHASAARSLADEDGIERTLSRLKDKNTENSRMLIEGLRHQRKHNLYIDQQMFKVDAGIRRLHTAKLLLSAMPSSASDERRVLSDLAAKFSQFMKVLLASKVDDIGADAQSVQAFDEALASLETRIQLTILKVAKTNFKSQANGSSEPTSLSGVQEILKSLKMESEEQSVAFEKWKSMAEQAARDDQELLKLVASQRSTLCEASLTSLNRNIEVLSLVSLSLVSSSSTS